MLDKIGFVIIGRNEGQRLVDCFNSIKLSDSPVVYVDSGSSDRSVEEARLRGVIVVSLDMQTKFTAARARNAGFSALIQQHPNLDFVHFLDGDCSVDANWVQAAIEFITPQPTIGIVCGRRVERFPQKSTYNQLCDIEWNTPVGEAKYCGGDALFRANAFQSVNGFNEHLIAGEEPELCIRIRQKGYKIWRLDHQMTLHDAAIYKFSQWWKRVTRGGYAFAEGRFMHGAPPESHWVTESNRAWLWGAVFPLLFLGLLAISSIWSLSIIFIYLLQYVRILSKNKKYGTFATKYAFYLLLGKFAEAHGQIKFHLNKLLNKSSTLIEYK